MPKNISIWIAIAVMAVLGWYIVQKNAYERLYTPDGQFKRYQSEEFGFEFYYPKNYFLEEREVGDGHRTHYLIMLTEDTEENRLVREGNPPAGGAGREGPIAITIDIYQNNLDQLTLEQWLKETNNSNFKLSPDGKYSYITVAGRKAVLYRWSGLYEADNVAFVKGDNVYSIAVTYIAKEDLIRNDFALLLGSIQFKEDKK